jgi:hypothetical protein
VFNFAVKANVEIFEEYIINVFSYTLKDITSYTGHNYMSKCLDCIFLELIGIFVNIIKRLIMISKYAWS